MDISTLGIDIGKNWFHIVGLNRAGKPILREKRRRKDLMPFLANLPPCLVGMEACPGSQQLARSLIAQGHQARIIPAQFVRPFLRSDKNDFNDATAITEAVTQPTMRFVPVKNTEQLDLQALHRARDRFVHDRTAVINQIRAFADSYLPIVISKAQIARLRTYLVAASGWMFDVYGWAAKAQVRIVPRGGPSRGSVTTSIAGGDRRRLRCAERGPRAGGVGAIGERTWRERWG